MDPTPTDLIRDWLLAEAGGDVEAALELAATTILGLASTTSYGLIRTVPYAHLLPPKPPPPAPAE